MKITCAIVDDSENDVRRINEALLNLTGDTKTQILTDTFTDPSDPAILQKHDLYILDVDMPGISGIELTEKIQKANSDAAIILCTSYDQFIFDSYRLNAFYFVRKSQLYEDMLYAIRKYISRHQVRSYVCHTNESTIVIRYDEIAYIEGVHNDIYIHCSDGTEHRERKSIQKVLEELTDSRFVMIDKGFLLNVQFIEKLESGNVTLKDGGHMPVQKTRQQELEQRFIDWKMR